jgi:hypothetical protein
MKSQIRQIQPKKNPARPVSEATPSVPMVSVAIDRLVFDGYSRLDSVRIKDSLDRSLHALCVEHAHHLQKMDSIHLERLSNLSLNVSSTTSPRILGEKIARLIFERLLHE